MPDDGGAAQRVRTGGRDGEVRPVSLDAGFCGVKLLDLQFELANAEAVPLLSSKAARMN